MSMAQNKHTEEQLQEASDHLHYEFWMFISIAEALCSGIAEKGWLENALLESFLIHFRALCDFFYPPQNVRKDDVLAEHYFFINDQGWKEIRPPMLSKTLEIARTRANKELAHVTYTRLTVTSDAKSWPVTEIACELMKLMKMFRENVLKTCLSSKWNASEKTNLVKKFK